VNLNPVRFSDHLSRAWSWFAGWRSLEAFGKRLHQINGFMDGEFLFNRSNLQWFREALTLVD
jgi:hypothetical protein